MRRLAFSLICAFLLLTLGVSSAPAGLVAFGPWSGAVTSSGAVVIAKLNTPRFSTLEVSEERFFTRVYSFGEVTEKPGDLREMAHFRAGGLKPNTKYFYRIRAGDERDDARTGTFTTFPREGEASSFKFAFASCAETGSQHPVFAEIKSQAPLFYLNVGDLHYENLARNDRTLFRAAYDLVLNSTTQGDLYRSVPFVYIWDDHDYGPDNSDRHSPSRVAAHASYREYVPHYPLAADAEPAFVKERADGVRPISQAFTVGRVRFIVLDTRSERDPSEEPDGAHKTMLGAWQKAWFQKELLAANGKFPLIFVVSSVTWISDDTTTRDNWGRFATERAELSNWMVEQGIRGVCFLSGDAHMLAADDGSHNAYASNGGPGYPVLQAASLDRPGSVKGGPWSVAPVLPTTGEGQFGLVEVQDRGEAITVTFRGLNHDGREKLRYEFSVRAK